MVKNIQKDFEQRAQGFANWLDLALLLNQNFYEVAIVGKDFKTLGEEIARAYVPNSILVGSPKDGAIKLLQNRFAEDLTLIYVCQEGACKLPVDTASKALQLVSN